MTMRQKKGIRAGVLTLLLLLLAIGTFDSRHGNLAARAESRDITSGGNMNYWRAEANLPEERMAAVQSQPRVVEIEKVAEVDKVVAKKVEVKVEVPVEVEKDVKVVKYVETPVKAKPNPTPWEMPRNRSDDHLLVKKPDPVQEPGPKPDTGVDFGPGDEPGPGDDGDGNKGHGNDEDGYDPDPGDDGDGNKGHGNDEDGYDEDNPGRGGFGGVGSSNGRSGHGGSGGSGGRGNSGGSKGRG